MHIDLSGKSVLVTGGSRGIGKSIAYKMAEAGANVSITYGSSAEAAEKLVQELQDKGVQALAIQADAADFDAAQSVVDQVVEAMGRLDVLVNNAGITQDNLILRMTEEAWDRVLATNLKSVFNYTKAAVTPMIRAKSGSMINVSSIIGITGNAGQSNYAASKAGIIGFSKSMAKELASRNVRVNVVAPGYIMTDMTEALNEKALEAIKAAVPMKRGGESVEVANACLFLASDLASYITGEVLKVDGGMAI